MVAIAGMGFDQRLQCYLPLLRLQMRSCGQAYRTSVLPGAPSLFNSLVGTDWPKYESLGMTTLWKMALGIHLEAFFCWSLECNIGNKLDTQHDIWHPQVESLAVWLTKTNGETWWVQWWLPRSSFIASLQWLAGRWDLRGAKCFRCQIPTDQTQLRWSMGGPKALYRLHWMPVRAPRTMRHQCTDRSFCKKVRVGGTVAALF